MTAHQWTTDKICHLFSSTWTALALHGGLKLDLFTILDKGPATGLTLIELAEATGADLRAMGMLTTALVAVDLLGRQGEKLQLNDFSRRYLSTASDDYYGFIIKHKAHIMADWLNLDQAVITGTRLPPAPVDDAEDEERREAFLMGMFNVAQQQAGQVTTAFDLSGRGRLLDLGGGPGTYAINFCQKNSQLMALIFDQPGTEEFATATVARHGLENRIKFKGGNFLHDELPDNFDVVWLSQVLHGEGPEDAARLVKRAAGVLDSGGIMGIQEFIVDDDRCGPPQPALFALNMLVETPLGQVYTQGEIKAMMAEAGLKDIQRLKADLPPGCGILTGVKP